MRPVNSARASLFLQIILLSVAKTPSVRFSVPEGHYIILICPGHAPSDSGPLEWRDGAGRVIAVTQPGQKVAVAKEKFSLLQDGSLFIMTLQQADSGQYHCNGQLVADVEILTGLDFVVSAGRTMLLPCKVTAEKQKEKWMFGQTKHSKRKPIFVKYKNGTVRKEMEDPQSRFTHMPDRTLRIANLQAVDTGEYWCSGKKAAKLTVRTDEPVLPVTAIASITPITPDYTNQIADTTEETDTETDEAETDDTGHERVMVAILTGLCVLVLLAGFVIFLVLTRKGNRKGNEQEPAGLPSQRLPDQVTSAETRGEAQWRPLVEANEIHYASLGRQNWREGSRAQGESHHVIYSTVIGGPEVDNTKLVTG